MEKVEGFYTIGEILQGLYGDRLSTETEKADAETRITETVCRISDLLDGMREMTFDEKYAPLYRRTYEFHKRHWQARTEGDFEKMAFDETFYCEKHPDFSVALFWAVGDEVMRGLHDG